jgi:hypothetical protein
MSGNSNTHMLRFISEFQLPSCKVTKPLLQSIEKYLKATIPGQFSSDRERQQLEKGLYLSIFDVFGVGVAKSIDEFAPVRFSDTTNCIKIGINMLVGVDDKHLELEIQFHRFRWSSRAKVDCHSPNARELVMGLREGILSLIAPHKTSSWLFNPPAVLHGVLLGIGGALLGMYGASFLVSSPPPFATVLCLTFILYVSVPLLLNPYTAFDSARNDMLNAWWKRCVGFYIAFVVSTPAWGTMVELWNRAISSIGLR